MSVQSASQVSREEALHFAARAIENLDAHLLRVGHGVISVGSERITAPKALHAHLVSRIAATLQGAPLEGAQIARFRRTASVMRDRLRQLQQRVSLDARPFLRASAAPRRALFVPRQWNHLRDLRPVARALRRGAGYAIAWLTFRRDHYDTVARDGDPVVLADSLAFTARAVALGSSVEAMARDLDAMHLVPRWGSLTELVMQTVREQVPQMAKAAEAIEWATIRLQPDVVLVGNPCTLEGRLAIAAGRGQGIPTAGVQHGELLPGDPIWSDVDVDLMCVWGARPREILERSGFPARRLAVTGAPWMDELPIHAMGRTHGKGIVLVALSGAGHSVGLAEHFATVRRLCVAADRCRDLQWIFRLHPKDDPAIYQRELSRVPQARAQVLEAHPTRPDIHEQLGEVDVLITVTSMAALDAMYRGVPVVTLGRPAGEMIPEHVRMGATVHVGMDESLETRLRDLIANGSDPAVREAAREYVTGYFGTADGEAARRVAERLARLGRPRCD